MHGRPLHICRGSQSQAIINKFIVVVQNIHIKTCSPAPKTATSPGVNNPGGEIHTYFNMEPVAKKPDAESAIITQKIGAEFSAMRNKQNHERLISILNEFDTVMYVMGENHVYADYEALHAIMGTPKIIGASGR